MIADDDKSGLRKQIASWHLVRELGRGGMGTVYEAIHVESGERRALKIFTLDHGKRDFLRKRFLAEAKLLAKLESPHLVKVRELAIDEAGGTPYFVMDLVLNSKGLSETLEDARKSGQVTEKRALEWYEDLRQGLAYIHSQGIVHRDVKLENVLVNSEGHAVLSDFGVSRIFDARVRSELMVTATMITGATTGTKPVMGTYWYLAPEIRRGDEATPASDWYALGVLLYRLLTGLWYEPNTHAFDLLAPFSKECQRILRRLLSDDPAARTPVSPATGKTPANAISRASGIVVGVALVLGLSAFLFHSSNFRETAFGVNPQPSTLKPQTSNHESQTESLPLSLHYCKGVDFEFRPCPAGTNTLGRKTVAVTRPYWLGEAPVTWREWRAVEGKTYEGGWNGRGRAPATYLTYGEVQTFCARLTRRFAKSLPEGYEIRLPTIAEWRLAYQMGETDPAASEGNTYAARRARCEIGWFGEGANGQWETSNMRQFFEVRNLAIQRADETWPEFPPRQIESKRAERMREASKCMPVSGREKPPNKLGLYDMYGNCFEMCFDCVSTNDVFPEVASEFGLRVRSPYLGQGTSLVDPVGLTGPMPTMLGTYLSPGLSGDDVWAAPFDRLPHLGFRLCIGPKRRVVGNRE